MKMILFQILDGPNHKPGYIVQEIMAFAPFWCIIPGVCRERLTNSEVENHFASVKRPIKKGSRLPISAFVNSRFMSIKLRVARLVSFSLTFTI